MSDATQKNQLGENYVRSFEEKRDASLLVKCKPSERKTWTEVFGWQEVSRAARELLNAEVERRRRKRKPLTAA